MNLAEMLAMADQATQNIEIKTEFELIEPGNYNVAITGAEGPKESARTNPNNPAEHGQHLVLECTITGPKYAGRKLWFHNNIICYPKDNSADSVKRSQTAMAMGAKERKIMLDSIGKAGIQTAQELIGAQFIAVVAIEKGTNGYKDKSVIKSIRPLNGAPTASKPISAPTPTAAPTASPDRPKMPWEK